MVESQVKIPSKEEYDKAVYNFLCRLLHPEEFGWSVTSEVRDNARRLRSVYRAIEGMEDN
jgi:hypothetical protein